MSIDAIAGLGAAASPFAAVSATGPAAQVQAPTASSNGTFGVGLASAIDELQALQAQSDALAVQAVTGDLDDVHDYTIASTQSAVALELTAALRNKAVDAFNEIMRMQA